MFATSTLSMGVHMPHITRICLILQELYTLPHQHLLKNMFRKLVELGDLGCNHMHICTIITHISDHRSKKGYIIKPTIECCRSNTCLREHLFQHFGFKITINQSNCCSSCQAEFQDGKMLHTVVLNENVRAIDRGN